MSHSSSAWKAARATACPCHVTVSPQLPCFLSAPANSRWQWVRTNRERCRGAHTRSAHKRSATSHLSLCPGELRLASSELAAAILLQGRSCSPGGVWGKHSPRGFPPPPPDMILGKKRQHRFHSAKPLVGRPREVWHSVVIPAVLLCQVTVVRALIPTELFLLASRDFVCLPPSRESYRRLGRLETAQQPSQFLLWCCRDISSSGPPSCSLAGRDFFP